MQKITTHLWFDKEAKEAASFYTSIFENSQIKSSTTLHDTPSGDVDMLTIELCGEEFAFISAGPLFKFTPAISFFIFCQSPEEVESLWQKFLPGGKVLMELGKYPFSEKYGWIQDKYGLSWQIIFMDKQAVEQKIMPSLLFVGKVAGKAEEAIHFYTSVFKNSSIGDMMRYGKNQEPDREGTLTYARFTLENQQFAAMDSAQKHEFTFTEATSFIVHCEDQAELDYYWEKLSADPTAEQCGWLKDKYGVSWQIVPNIMNEMMNGQNPEKMKRVTQAFLQMKKFDIAKLKAAYDGVG